MKSPNTNQSHYPVMLDQALDFLSVIPQGVYVDGTFGVGGYTRAILRRQGRVFAFDQDPQALAIASTLKDEYGDQFTFCHSNFRYIKKCLAKFNVEKVNGIVLDLGVSSPQLDTPHRGFSFRHDGPLDMRMSQEGTSAADIINTAKESEIASIFWKYGDEKKSRKIARAIVEYRQNTPINTTHDLSSIISLQFSEREKAKSKINVATRCFQALRIHVNEELKALEEILEQVPYILKKDGRLVIVTFHSLEDRIVKNFIKEKSGQKASILPKDLQTDTAFFKNLTRKAILPSQEECANNTRSRSAKLRAAKLIKQGQFSHISNHRNHVEAHV